MGLLCTHHQPLLSHSHLGMRSLHGEWSSNHSTIHTWERAIDPYNCLASATHAHLPPCPWAIHFMTIKTLREGLEVWDGCVSPINRCHCIIIDVLILLWINFHLSKAISLTKSHAHLQNVFSSPVPLSSEPPASFARSACSL